MTRILTEGAELGGYYTDINAAYFFKTWGVEGGGWGMQRDSSVKRSGNYSWSWWTYNLNHQIFLTQMTPGGAGTNEIYLRMGLRWDYRTNVAQFFHIAGGDGIGLQRNGADQLRLDAPWGTAVHYENLANSTWHLIEIHFKATNPATVEMKANGNLVYSSSSISMSAGNIWRLQFWTNQNNQVFWMDDLAVNDATSGSYNTGWIGDGHVEVIKPNAAGDVTQLISSTGNPNYQNVDEIPFDGAGNNSGSTAGQYDLYNFESCGLSNVGFSSVNVIGMGIAETDNGLACRSIIKTSGSEALGTEDTNYLRTGGWDYIMGKYWAKKPDGTDWTVADIDSIQAGFRITDG